TLAPGQPKPPEAPILAILTINPIRTRSSVFTELGAHLVEERPDLTGEVEPAHSQLRGYTLDRPALPIAKFQGLAQVRGCLIHHIGAHVAHLGFRRGREWRCGDGEGNDGPAVVARLGRAKVATDCDFRRSAALSPAATGLGQGLPGSVLYEA